MSRVLCALMVSLALATSADARADGATEARFHDSLGRAAYQRGRFADALAHFLDAHAAAPSALSAYNIALSADLAGEAVLAFHFFEQYLTSDDADPARRGEATRRRDRLAAGLALLRVESDPPGATIRVDRAELGEWGTTPRTIAVPPGPHRVVLALADHQEVAVEAEARVGEVREVRAALPRRTGTLLVETRPRGAEVVVSRDGEILARGEGGAPIEVPVGRCEVRVTAPGRLAVERAVRVGADAEARVVLHAPPLPIPRGRLLVRTTEGTARVWIDGALRGTTPLVLPAEPAGVHQVELEADGFVPWRAEVSVRESRATYLNVTLTPAR